VHHLELGASHDGQLQAMRHHTKQHTAIREDFAEATSFTSRMLYACPNYEAVHETARVNVMKPAWMRAPGEAPHGSCALYQSHPIKFLVSANPYRVYDCRVYF
jgi:xanthine dehydrogenase YagR molybdenum-binding subunit